MLFSFFLSFAATAAELPHSYLNSPDREVRFEATWEIGSLAVFKHSIQAGKNGTVFDYVEDGGQDNLFPYQRFEVNFRVNNRHSFLLLYQPLNLLTKQEASTDLQFDLETFPQGTPMDYRYGFDYTRGTWLYDFVKSPGKTIAFGAALQLRNATLEFSSADGEIRNSNRDIGPVPLLASRGRFQIDKQRWWGFDFAGAYAPIKYINGSDSDVVGALLDTSVRTGIRLNRGVNTFVNLRYVGGGAEGTESNPIDGKDGFIANWVHLGAISIGFMLR